MKAIKKEDVIFVDNNNTGYVNTPIRTKLTPEIKAKGDVKDKRCILFPRRQNTRVYFDAKKSVEKVVEYWRDYFNSPEENFIILK